MAILAAPIDGENILKVLEVLVHLVYMLLVRPPCMVRPQLDESTLGFTHVVVVSWRDVFAALFGAPFDLDVDINEMQRTEAQLDPLASI